MVLEMRGVSKRYHAGIPGCSASALALDDVDLSVRAGERVGVLGPRGAGKTTLLFCAAGLARPDAGIVRWRGSARLADRRGIAFADDREALYAFLTVRETLHHHLAAAALEPHEREVRVARAIAAAALDAVAECRLSLLPSGTRRRVALAQALLTDPWLLLLDGVIDALPRADAAVVRSALAAVAARGCGVVISSSDAAVLSGMETRIVSLRAPGTVGRSRALTSGDIAPARIALVREHDDIERR